MTPDKKSQGSFSFNDPDETGAVKPVVGWLEHSDAHRDATSQGSAGLAAFDPPYQFTSRTKPSRSSEALKPVSVQAWPGVRASSLPGVSAPEDHPLIVHDPQRDARKRMAHGSGLVADLADTLSVIIGGRAGQRTEVRMIQVRQARVESLELSRRLSQPFTRGDARLEDRLPYLEGGDRRQDRRAKRHHDRPSQAPGAFPRQASVRIAEAAPPEVFQEHWHDRDVLPAGHDDFQPAVKRSGQPIPGHLSLGEKAQNTTVGKHLAAGFATSVAELLDLRSKRVSDRASGSIGR